MSIFIAKRREEEPEEFVEKAKDHMLFIRLPKPISDRFRHQSERLSCTMGVLGRMAIIKFLEEEEANENQNQRRDQ
jgi:hypothetical protein